MCRDIVNCVSNCNALFQLRSFITLNYQNNIAVECIVTVCECENKFHPPPNTNIKNIVVLTENTLWLSKSKKQGISQNKNQRNNSNRDRNSVIEEKISRHAHTHTIEQNFQSKARNKQISTNGYTNTQNCSRSLLCVPLLLSFISSIESDIQLDIACYKRILITSFVSMAALVYIARVDGGKMDFQYSGSGATELFDSGYDDGIAHIYVCVCVIIRRMVELSRKPNLDFRLSCNILFTRHKTHFLIY